MICEAKPVIPGHDDRAYPIMADHRMRIIGYEVQRKMVLPNSVRRKRVYHLRTSGQDESTQVTQEHDGGQFEYMRECKTIKEALDTIEQLGHVEGDRIYHHHEADEFIVRDLYVMVRERYTTDNYRWSCTRDDEKNLTKSEKST